MKSLIVRIKTMRVMKIGQMLMMKKIANKAEFPYPDLSGKLTDARYPIGLQLP